MRDRRGCRSCPRSSTVPPAGGPQPPATAMLADAGPPSTSSCCWRTPPAIEYERPLVARPGRRAPTATELAELERAKLLALEVREAFAARRRREAELSALFDTANDLAALRDLDAVLTAIVRRARQLLGTDVSYLTLNDPAARRHVHAGHRRLGVRPLPAPAAADGRRAGRPGRADRRAVRDRQLLRRRPVPAHRRDQRRRPRRGARRDPRRPADPRLAGDRRAVRRRPDRAARSTGRRCRCSGRWPRTRRSPSTTPGCWRRPGRRSTSCRRPAGSSARTPPRSSGRPAAHDRFIDLVLRGGGVEDVAAAVTEALGGSDHRPRRGGPGDPLAPSGEDEDDPRTAPSPDPAAALTMARVDRPHGPRRRAGGPPR